MAADDDDKELSARARHSDPETSHEAAMMKEGRPKRGNENPVLESVGIDKNLAKAARKAYPEGWPRKPIGGRKVNAAIDFATAYRTKTGKLPLRDEITKETGISHGSSSEALNLIKSREETYDHALQKATARIAELEAENARLKADLEALQAGNLMQMSRAALEQRRALIEKMKTKREQRAAVETVPDEKTKEAFERQIKALKGQLKNAKSTILAFQANGKTILDKDDRRAILVCLHPDGVVDPNEKAKREKAFKLFSNAIPELGDA